MISNGLEIGRRALITNMQALDVIAHNVANANTEGYSRQTVSLSATAPTTIPTMNKYSPFASLGTGVKLNNINRIRDEFLDSQMRDESETLGQWDAKQSNYSIIGSALNEPSDQSISSLFDAFWNSWQALTAPDPSSSGVRNQVVSESTLLANTFNRTASQLKELQANDNEDIKNVVTQINDLTDQIAIINKQIVEMSALGSANDLKDQRTKLVTELSTLININYIEDEHGAATLSTAGGILVSGNTAEHIETTVNADNNGYYDVIWSNSKLSVNANNGRLFGLIDSRDTIVQGYIDQLDTTANTLINSVNLQHAKGYDLNGNSGQMFFTGSTASDIALSSEIQSNPSKIAASSSADNPEGNGENGLALARLRDLKLLANDSATIDDYYKGVVSALGIKTQEAGFAVNTQNTIIKQINTKTQSISGVSIDEEMTDMLKFQHSYQAAAKYVTVINQLLDTLMNLVK